MGTKRIVQNNFYYKLGVIQKISHIWLDKENLNTNTTVDEYSVGWDNDPSSILSCVNLYGSPFSKERNIKAEKKDGRDE